MSFYYKNPITVPPVGFGGFGSSYYLGPNSKFSKPSGGVDPSQIPPNGGPAYVPPGSPPGLPPPAGIDKAMRGRMMGTQGNRQRPQGRSAVNAWNPQILAQIMAMMQTPQPQRQPQGLNFMSPQAIQQLMGAWGNR